MNVNDPRFDDTYGPSAVEPKRRSKWAPCLIGCLAVFVVVMLLMIVAAIWAYRNWRAPAAAIIEQVLSETIDAADLPVDEKQELKTQVKRVTDALREARLSREQLARIMEEFQNSSLMTLFVVSGIEHRYLDKSGLSDEEKADAKRTLQRYVRGVADDKIDEKSMDSVLTHIADRQPDGNWELRENVSDDDLRAALAEAKKQADDAGIPEEPDSFDPSDELKRIVDDALGKPAAAVEPQ